MRQCNSSLQIHPYPSLNLTNEPVRPLLFSKSWNSALFDERELFTVTTTQNCLHNYLKGVNKKIQINVDFFSWLLIYNYYRWLYHICNFLFLFGRYSTLLLCKMISTQIKRRKKSAKLQYYCVSFFVSSLYYIRLRPIIQLPYLAAKADGLLVLKTFGNISNPWPRQFEIWILQHISISCSKGGQGCYLVSTFFWNKYVFK